MIYQFKAEQTDAGLNFDISLDKDKRVYCFIGDNAVGKTNLLENMAKTMLYSHSMFKPHQKAYTFHGRYYLRGVMDQCEKLTIQLCSTIIANELLVKDKQRDDWLSLQFSNITPASNNNLFHFDKPFIFISARDRGYTENLAKDQIKVLGDNIERFISGLLKTYNGMTGKVNEKTDIADWFNSRLLINPNFIPQHEQRGFEVITVLELMKRLEPTLTDLVNHKDGRTFLNFSFQQGKLYFKNTPLDKLSTGYVAIVKIFQEIIAGYSGWTNAASSEELQQTDGIVFIDEIEAHLHPKWQCQFIPLLKEFFPRTTFYIATHSPLIVSTTEEGEAYELVRSDSNVTVKRLGNPQEWYLADVYAQGFHVDFSKAKSKSNGKPALMDLLKEFSAKVKDYTATKDAVLKDEVESLYRRILPSLPESDPRRRSLDSLRSLVQ